MFTSIIDTASGSISVASALICLAAALALGLVAAVVYSHTTEKYSKSFAITLVLLPALVQIVLLCVNGNLGTSVAVLGTFGLIRFRSIPGTSKEITSIFFSMAIGVACAMGQILYAVLFTVIIAAVMFLLAKGGFGRHPAAQVHLRVTVPEDLDYESAFREVFARYTRHAELELVKTVNLGSMYLLDYEIELKDPAARRQLIDELRQRNGNLSIACGQMPDKLPEM